MNFVALARGFQMVRAECGTALTPPGPGSSAWLLQCCWCGVQAPLSCVQGQVLGVRGMQGSVRSCWKVLPCLTEPRLQRGAALGTAQPGRDSGSTSGLLWDKASAQEQLEKRGVRQWEKQPCRAQGAAAGGQELLQAPEQRLPCSPWDIPDKSCVSMGILEQLAGSGALGQPHCSSLFLKHWTHGQGPTLEQFVSSCSVTAILLIVKFTFTTLQKVCDTEHLIFSRNPSIPFDSEQDQQDWSSLGWDSTETGEGILVLCVLLAEQHPALWKFLAKEKWQQTVGSSNLSSHKCPSSEQLLKAAALIFEWWNVYFTGNLTTKMLWYLVQVFFIKYSPWLMWLANILSLSFIKKRFVVHSKAWQWK